MKTCFAMIALGVLTLAAATDEGSFSRNLKVSGSVDLRVSTGAGYVKVSKGAGGEVRISARIKANNGWSFWSADPADQIKEVMQNPPIRQEGNRVIIGNDSHKWDRLSISYDITVPEDTKVTASSGSGSVDAYDVHGPADLGTGSGNVNAERIGAEVHAHTGSGNINVSRTVGALRANTGSGRIEASDITGSVDASTGSGNITVIHATGKVRAHAASGRVRVEKAVSDLDLHSSSGGVDVDGAPKASHWDIETASGTVHVSLPQNTGFELDAHASSGSVSTTHQIAVNGSMKHGELHGVAGHADNFLRIRTASGSIRIE